MPLYVSVDEPDNARMARRQSRALVLLAHGSPAPAWRQPLIDIAAAARAMTDDSVVLAWLAHAEPDLATCVTHLVAAGATRIEVTPLFFASGGHVTRDVPAIIATLSQRFKDVSITVGPAIGERPAVKLAIARSAVTPTD